MIVSLLIKFSLIYGAEHHECGTLEIRMFTDVQQLRNCTSIVGNLVLAFQHGTPDNYTSEEVNNLTFPLR